MNKRNFDRFKYQLPALLWAIFIFVLCTYPFNNLNGGGFFKDIPVDKFVHFFLFFVLAFLMMRGALKQSNMPASFKFRIILIALLYGILIELIQHYFTIKRSGDVWDVVADVTGAVLALLTFRYFLKTPKTMKNNFKKK